MTPGSPRDPHSQPAVPRERRTAGEERDEHDATLLLLLQLADTRSTATSYGHGSAVVLSFPHPARRRLIRRSMASGIDIYSIIVDIYN